MNSNEDYYERALEDIQRVYYEFNPSLDSYESFYQKIVFAREVKKLPVKEVLLLAITLLRDAVASEAECDEQPQTGVES